VIAAVVAAMVYVCACFLYVPCTVEGFYCVLQDGSSQSGADAQ
jgi:hypothetical protein